MDEESGGPGKRRKCTAPELEGVRSLHNERVKQGECYMSSHENWPSVGHGGCFANATSLAVRDQMHHISDGAIIYLQNRKKNQTC